MGRSDDPTPPEDATHLRIKPTEAPLTVDAVEQGFRQLHNLTSETPTSWRDRLFGDASTPTQRSSGGSTSRRVTASSGSTSG